MSKRRVHARKEEQPAEVIISTVSRLHPEPASHTCLRIFECGVSLFVLLLQSCKEKVLVIGKIS